MAGSTRTRAEAASSDLGFGSSGGIHGDEDRSVEHCTGGDRHLGPELESFINRLFAHDNVRVQMLGANAAYVTAEYSLARTVDDRQVTSGGLATYVLIRHDGRGVNRHIAAR